MGKLLKTFAGLLLLLFVAALLAALVVDPNDFKNEIESRLAATMGYEADISGDLRVLFIPRPGLEIGELILGPAAGADKPPLAEVAQVRLFPRLVPLLQGRTELDLVRLEGLRLHLILDDEGRGSWNIANDLPGGAGASQVSMAQDPVTKVRPQGFLDVSAEELSPSPSRPVTHRLELVDARVSWEDRRVEQRLELGGLDASAEPVVFGEKVALVLTGSLLDSAGGSPIGLDIETSLLLDSALQRLRLDDLRLGMEGLGSGAGLDASLLLRAALEVDLDARRYLADPITLEYRVAGAALGGGRIEGTSSARVTLDLAAETLKVADFSLVSGTLSARGAALGQSLLSAPVFTGDLALAPLDLRDWLEQRGLPTPWTIDADTFRSVSIDVCWRLESGQVGLQDLRLGIDETTFSGDLERVANGAPFYRFDLAADILDLDRYLPPDWQLHAGLGDKSWQPEPATQSVVSTVALDPDTPSATVVRVAAPAAAAPVPLRPRFADFRESLGDLELDGRLSFDELKLARLRYGDVDLRIRGSGGRLDMENKVERFYQGRLAGSLGLDLRGAEPRVNLAQRADGIHTGPLLADLSGTAPLTGRGEITADLEATGRSANALKGSLAGNLAIHVTEGAVEGFSLERMIMDARANLTGKKPAGALPTQTRFNDLRASARVEAGVVRNRDLVAIADNLRVTGKGTLDLGRERFDYRFAPMLVQPPEGSGIQELEGIPVPVHLTGSFRSPRWDVDVAGALSAVAERELRGQGGGLLKKLEERTGIKGLEQGLRGLFGR